MKYKHKIYLIKFKAKSIKQKDIDTFSKLWRKLEAHIELVPKQELNGRTANIVIIDECKYMETQ